MLLTLVRYATLFLIMTNLPGWALMNINPVFSSLLSYVSFGLMLVYFVLSKNWGLNIWMVILGATYYGIGSLTDQTYIPEHPFYLIIIIKFFIVAIAGYAVIKDMTKNELFVFLLIGVSSVFLQMFVFYDATKDYGRYSGFYMNPNSLGFICMMGYGLTYSLEKRWRLIGQIAFTFIGFLTFSRTFILIWLIMNLLSIRVSLKNLRVLAIGLGLFIGLLTFNAFLPKSNPRLEAMSNILEGKSESSKDLDGDSRTDTWAVYYDAMFTKPFLGHGYDAFRGGGKVSVLGPHNSYIKTWGEGGILPLLVMLVLLIYMLKKSWSNFLFQPHLFLMTLALCLFMTTNHGFWTSGYTMFFLMWLQYHIFKKKKNHKLHESNTEIANFT